METLEYRTVDKSSWRRGPWDDEPDKKQWQDETTGLPCLIVRNPGGALCGYVGLPPGHPLHGKDYSGPDVSVHGGLTFAASCMDASREKWEKWRQYMLDSREQAAKYPEGDAARRWKERGTHMNDYDAWRAHCEAAGICHKPSEGESDHVWWLGFDCSHYGDRTPAFERDFGRDGVYCDFAYVTNEVRELAKQLASATVAV